MLRLGASNYAVTPVVLNETSAASVLLFEAVEIYLTQKGQGRPVTFHRGAQRACGYVIDACGDKHLEVYTKADAHRFRDALIARGFAGSDLQKYYSTRKITYSLRTRSAHLAKALPSITDSTESEASGRCSAGSQ